MYGSVIILDDSYILFCPVLAISPNNNEIHIYEEVHKGAFIRIFPDPEDDPKEYLKYFEVAKKESKDFANKYHK